MAEFPAVTHVALTVTDLAVSTPWYQRLFGVEPVLDEAVDSEHYAVAFPLAGGMLFGLHTHSATTGDHHFNELRAGLDHVAFACADRQELEGWRTRLEEMGIAHGDIVDAHFGSGLAFRDPDNIALEFFAPPSAQG